MACWRLRGLPLHALPLRPATPNVQTPSLIAARFRTRVNRNLKKAAQPRGLFGHS